MTERPPAAGRGKATAHREGALEATPLPPRCRRPGWLAVVALLVFIAPCAALAGGFLHPAARLSFRGDDPPFFGLLAAASAALAVALGDRAPAAAARADAGRLPSSAERPCFRTTTINQGVKS